jgi:hypothetical protein
MRPSLKTIASITVLGTALLWPTGVSAQQASYYSPSHGGRYVSPQEVTSARVHQQRQDRRAQQQQRLEERRARREHARQEAEERRNRNRQR